MRGSSALVVASAGAFVATLSTSMVAVTMPVIARDLAVSQSSVSWILSAHLLAASVLLALAGRTADVFGTKRIYLTGFVFFVAGAAMCAAAVELPALVGARVLQGAGGAMMMAVGPSIVTRALPPARRGFGLGIHLAGTYVGLTIGPSLGGAIASAVSWNAVFLVVAAVGAGAGAIALLLLEPGATDDAPLTRPALRALDLPGAFLFAIVLGALVNGERLAATSAPRSATAAVAGVGLVALLGLVRHEKTCESPLLPLSLLRARPVAFGIAGATLLYTTTFTLSFLLPFHLQGELGLSPRSAGILMTAQPATMAIVAPLSGRIADRWSPRIPKVCGMVAVAVGLVLLSTPSTARPASLVTALSVVGLGAGLFVAPNSAGIMGAAPRERQSTAGAMAATARSVGMTLGIALGAALHQATGFARGVAIAAGLAALGAALASLSERASAERS